MYLALHASEPFFEPSCGGFAQRLAIHMLVVERRHLDPLGHAQRPVQSLQLRKGLASPFDRKKIADGRADQYRPRRDHAREFGVVDACAKKALNVLLRIGFGILNARLDLFRNGTQERDNRSRGNA